MVLRATAYHPGHGQAHHQGQHTGAQGGVAPAPLLHGPGHERDSQAAQGQPQAHDGQGAGALLFKPMNNGHRQGEIARQTGAHGHEGGAEVEGGDRIHLAEQQQPGAENHNAPANDGLRPQAVHQPAQQRPNDGRLGRLQGGRTAERGFAPAHFFRQHGDVQAKGLQQQGAQQKLYAAGGAHHLPAVKNLHSCLLFVHSYEQKP